MFLAQFAGVHIYAYTYIHTHAGTILVHIIVLRYTGQVVSWEETCRIKHLPTRLYLAVVKGELGGYKVRTCVLI